MLKKGDLGYRWWPPTVWAHPPILVCKSSAHHLGLPHSTCRNDRHVHSVLLSFCCPFARLRCLIAIKVSDRSSMLRLIGFAVRLWVKGNSTRNRALRLGIQAPDK